MLERNQARQQTEHALDTLRAQHEAQLTEQKKMLADERRHSKNQIAVVVDDCSARIRALESQVADNKTIVDKESEERELHFAGVCAVLIRAIHGLQHQLADMCGTSRVVQRMLRTGTGSNLHKDVVDLLQACTAGAPVIHENLDDQPRRWRAPTASFRTAVIAVMAIHRLQLIASLSWRCYGGALQVRTTSYDNNLPAIRLWVEEVDLATVLATLRDPGLEADDVAAQLVANSAVQADVPSDRVLRRSGQDLVVGLGRGLQWRCNGLNLAVDRYTPAATAMNELRNSVLGMSERLCTTKASEQTHEALQQQLQECMLQLQADDERMKRSEEELRKANEKIGHAKDHRKRCLAELAEAKDEIQALRLAVVRSTEAGERAAGTFSAHLLCATHHRIWCMQCLILHVCGRSDGRGQDPGAGAQGISSSGPDTRD